MSPKTASPYHQQVTECGSVFNASSPNGFSGQLTLYFFRWVAEVQCVPVGSATSCTDVLVSTSVRVSVFPLRQSEIYETTGCVSSYIRLKVNSGRLFQVCLLPSLISVPFLRRSGWVFVDLELASGVFINDHVSPPDGVVSSGVVFIKCCNFDLLIAIIYSFQIRLR